MTGRQVVLRDERNGRDSRHLSAHLNEAGDLVIAGQDLGPGTAPVSGDGEYEWSETVRAEHLADLIALLGGAPGVDVLDLLEGYAGARSFELERLLSGGEVPVEFWSYAG